MSLIKVNKNENPYDVIGNYIEKHVSVIDNVIAVISINGTIHNELFLIENSFTNSFIWEIDWWEGEENVELIDFFFVSEACKKYSNNDYISRQSAIDALNKLSESTYEVNYGVVDCDDAINAIAALPPTEPKKGKWIKVGRWGRVYKCNRCGNLLDFDGVNAGRGSANFCPNCGADMRGEQDDKCRQV